MNLSRVQNMASVNLQEQKIFPKGKYKLTIWSDDHNSPHFHVESTEEGYEVTLLIETGELHQVKRYGKRNKSDKFEDVVAKAK